MFGAGSIRYEGFSSPQTILSVLVDNSFLIVLAVGMTFVILTGGIDLSVGSVVALSTHDRRFGPALRLVGTARDRRGPARSDRCWAC